MLKPTFHITDTYKVTYDGNESTDGSAPTDSSHYESGNTVTVLGNTGSLTNIGKTFTGWNTQPDGNGIDRAPASTFAIGSDDVTLYAKWTALPTYTVTYDANTGTGIEPADGNNYLPGATVTLLGPGTLTKSGYTFTCWNTQADGNGTDRTPTSTFAIDSADIILYAKWTALLTYTVTYDANTGTGIEPGDGNNYLAGASVTVLGSGSLTKSGYTFTSWNTQADGNGTDRTPTSTFAIGSDNVILYAKWTALPTYTVTYDANTGTGGLPSDTNNYLAGASVTVLGFETLTKSGYTFACWNTQADGNGTDRTPTSTFSIGSANVTLYAKWTALPTYTVSYNANTGTGGLPSDTNSYLSGASVTVLGFETLTKSGYTFACWNTQADSNGTDRTPASTFSIGSANVTLYAKWTALPTYTVSYDANTGTGGLPSDTNSYLSGASVTVLGSGTLTKSGYTFTCWNTQADGNGTDRTPASTFSIGSANVTLYAKWTALPTYTVTYNANTGSGGVPTDSNSYLAGATVTVLGSGTLTKSGYTFTCWNTQSDGNGTDRAPASTFSIGSANVILYAKWTALPTYTVTYNANTGSGGVPADSNSYLSGASVTVLGSGTLTKSGYTFTCWNTQADGNGTDRTPASTFTIGSANVTLYAKWTALTAGTNLNYPLPSSISFNMKYVPGGTFPTGADDLGGNQTISIPYWMSETEVTYELWYAVHTWAIANGYTFANPGREGHDGTITNPAGAPPTAAKQEPVTTINWRDAMIWTNALTDYYNANNGSDPDLDCVYYSNSGYTVILKNSSDGTYGSSVNTAAGSFDNPYVKASAKGFRLSGIWEWECAARYKDGISWTPGTYASGASADYNDAAATGLVAWYGSNSSASTHPVKGKTANTLGIYDMSGNARELCFNWDPLYIGDFRVMRGGNYSANAQGVGVGPVGSVDPYYEYFTTGFRFVRTH